MRWALGEEVIQRLLRERELQRVPHADNMAESMLSIAEGHLKSVPKIRNDDPEGAYVLCYDAARKGCAALLQAQGLRATSSGGHIALKEAITAQFGNTPQGRVLRRLDQMRRRRNVLEYGGQPDELVTPDELDEVVFWTTSMLAFCARLLPELRAFQRGRVLLRRA